MKSLYVMMLRWPLTPLFHRDRYTHTSFFLISCLCKHYWFPLFPCHIRHDQLICIKYIWIKLADVWRDVLLVGRNQIMLIPWYLFFPYSFFFPSPLVIFITFENTYWVPELKSEQKVAFKHIFKCCTTEMNLYISLTLPSFSSSSIWAMWWLFRC